MIRISLLRGGKTMRTWRVRADTATIGSEPGSTIRVRGGAGIAPTHATLYVEEGEISIVAEDESELLLNGEQVDFAVPRPSDVLQAGRMTFKVEWVADEVERAEATEEVPRTPAPAEPRSTAPAPTRSATPARPRSATPAPTRSATPATPRSATPAPTRSATPAPTRGAAPAKPPSAEARSPKAAPPATAPRAKVPKPPTAVPPYGAQDPVERPFPAGAADLFAPEEMTDAAPLELDEVTDTRPIRTGTPREFPSVFKDSDFDEANWDEEATVVAADTAALLAAAGLHDEAPVLSLDQDTDVSVTHPPLRADLEQPTAEVSPEAPWAPPREDSWWDDDDDDDEFSFEEPFDLAEVLLEARAPSEGRAKSGRCTALVVRVVGGRVVETFDVQRSRPYSSPSGEVTVRLVGGNAVLTAVTGLSGQIRQEGTTDLSELSQTGAGYRTELSPGDSAILRDDLGAWKVDVFHPPATPRGISLAAIPVFLGLGVVTFIGHVVFGVLLTMSQPEQKVVEEEVGEEMFAEVEMDRPEAAKPKEAPQPKSTLQMAEKAPAVTATEVQEISERPRNTSVDSLLETLTRGTGLVGAAGDLSETVSSVDALPGGLGGTSGFDLAGALSAVEGDGVAYARAGGEGGISTRSGDEVGADAGKLVDDGSRGAVRAQVTKVSSQMKVAGSLSREAVSRVVSAHIHEIQGCYERQLLANPGLSGRIVYEWTVVEDGTVKGVRVASSTVSSTETADCITTLIKKWQFEQPEGGEVVITYPFLFRSMQ